MLKNINFNNTINGTISVNNVSVCGLSKVIQFRRSFDSVNKSDSEVSMDTTQFDCVNGAPANMFITQEMCSLGPKDLAILRSNVLKGDSHSKIGRMVNVYHELTLPRRVWVDYDTYRLGRACYDVEYFSDSTMHTIHKRELNHTDFDAFTPHGLIANINRLICDYNANKKDQDLFLILKSTLPEGFLQTRLVMANYQALRHIYFDREKHRQPEFRVYCDWIKTLPYAEELITCKI